MAKLGCQIKGTSKIVKKSFGGVAAITDAIGTAVPASQLSAGVKSTATTQAEKKEAEKQEPQKMKRGGDVQPPKTKKYFRATKSGAGMTKAGVERYRRENPGSKLKTAVTGKVKPGSKAAKRRKSYCARSLGQLKRASAKTRNDPNSRIRQARRRWKC
jgi:hypothetical protein